MKKKICFIVSSPFTAKVFLSNHIKELSLYYDISLVANFPDNNVDILSDLPSINMENIPIARKISILQDLKSLLILRKYFKDNNFDAIHSVTPKAGLLTSIAGKLAGIKKRIHIFTGQVWYTQTGLMKKLLMFLDKCIVWNVNYILVDGYSQRDFLISKKIIKDSNSKVLGKGSISGVDTTKFTPDINIYKAVRQELGIDDDTIVFMFLGRLNKDKGVFDLVEAFIQLRKRYEKICLLLVGSDEENVQNKVMSKYKDIQSIIFFGQTNHPERMLQACDIFCLPSYREGFGTSVIEASLMTKPVISSDTYGLKDTIIEQETGLRHRVMDVASLVKQMEVLIKNPDMRFSLGKNGRNYVLENFSSQKITEEWVRFYREILDHV